MTLLPFICGFGRGIGRTPLALVLAAGLLAMGPAGSPAQAQSEGGNVMLDERAPYHLIVGVDVSENSPFVTDRRFSRKTALRIAKHIENLPVRSVVSFRVFGAQTIRDTTIDFDRQVSRGRSAEQIADFISTLIENMPKLVRKDRIKVQKKSNILGFLNSMSRSTECGRRQTAFILATDGMEDSELLNLAEGGTLPPVDHKRFNACTRLEMLGIGRATGSVRQTERIIYAWQDWAAQAGFTLFVGLDDW